MKKSGLAPAHVYEQRYEQRRYDMRHEMLTQCAPFCIDVMAGHAESAFHDACRTSSGVRAPTCIVVMQLCLKKKINEMLFLPATRFTTFAGKSVKHVIN